MKSAILNSAFSQIVENTNSGVYFSVTHFSLGWASNDERNSNPIKPTMSEVIQQTVTKPIISYGTGTVGNGSVGSLSYPTGAVFETITITFSSATAFTALGSVSGALGSGVVGTAFIPSVATTVRFTVTAGSVAFVSGNTMSFHSHPYILGDLIFNIWQTPFPHDQYAGSYYELNESFAKDYQYEYDACYYKNTLKCNTVTHPTSATWPVDLSSVFPYGTILSGYTNPSVGNPTIINNKSQLTEANIPYYLDYSIPANQTKGVTTFSKLFPVKAYNIISKEDVDGSVTVNYNLNLPAISSSIANQINFYANSIGNFKFNRVGLYMTVGSKQQPSDPSIPEDVYTPQANQEPVLFAVIDIGVDSCTSNDVRFDIYKTRDDSGFSGWDFDAQLRIANTSNNALIETDATYLTYYADAMRDDATKYYQAQIMNNASMSETIMQLQMMVLQLATSFQQFSGTNPFTSIKVAGYNVEAILNVDKEYIISKGSANSRMLLDGAGFRGVNELGVDYINSSNALFSFKTYSSNNIVEDGDLIKLTLYNLDGRFYSVAGNDISWWNGEISFANYDEISQTKTKIFEINSNLIKGLDFAKVTVMFSYSSSLKKWVLENLSIIDESSVIS